MSCNNGETPNFGTGKGAALLGSCQKCHRAHLRCDRALPTCGRCKNFNLTCEYVLKKKPGRKPRLGQKGNPPFCFFSPLPPPYSPSPSSPSPSPPSFANLNDSFVPSFSTFPSFSSFSASTQSQSTLLPPPVSPWLMQEPPQSPLHPTPPPLISHSSTCKTPPPPTPSIEVQMVHFAHSRFLSPRPPSNQTTVPPYSLFSSYKAPLHPEARTSPTPTALLRPPNKPLPITRSLHSTDSVQPLSSVESLLSIEEAAHSQSSDDLSRTAQSFDEYPVEKTDSTAHSLLSFNGFFPSVQPLGSAQSMEDVGGSMSFHAPTCADVFSHLRVTRSASAEMGNECSHVGDTRDDASTGSANVTSMIKTMSLGGPKGDRCVWPDNPNVNSELIAPQPEITPLKFREEELTPVTAPQAKRARTHETFVITTNDDMDFVNSFFQNLDLDDHMAKLALSKRRKCVSIETIRKMVHSQMTPTLLVTPLFVPRVDRLESAGAARCIAANQGFCDLYKCYKPSEMQGFRSFVQRYHPSSMTLLVEHAREHCLSTSLQPEMSNELCVMCDLKGTWIEMATSSTYFYDRCGILKYILRNYIEIGPRGANVRLADLSQKPPSPPNFVLQNKSDTPLKSSQSEKGNHPTKRDNSGENDTVDFLSYFANDLP